MSRARIVILPPDLTEPPEVLLFETEGGVLQRGHAVLGEPAAPMRTVAIAPGAAVLTRVMRLPTRSEAQARAAAVLELEDELASDTAGVHLAVGPLREDGTRIVCVAADARMRAWSDLLVVYGLQADVLLPDYLALPDAPPGEPLNLARRGSETLLRGERLACAVDPETAALLVGEHAVIDRTAEWERCVLEAATRPPVNLLQGAFDPARSESIEPRRWRRLAALAAAVVVSPVVLTLAGAVHDQLTAGRIERRTEARLAAVLPKGTQITNPAEQAQARLAQARIAAGGGPAALTAALFAIVEQIDQGQVESMVAMPDGSLRATLSFANITDLELLRAQMRRAGLAFREEGAREEGGRAVGDIIVGARS